MGKYILEDFENTMGEMDLERARYLQSADEMLEEMLSHVDTASTMKAGNKARTVCHGMLIDTDKAPVAIAITGEQFLVCNDSCKKFVETATPQQIKVISTLKCQLAKELIG